MGVVSFSLLNTDLAIIMSVCNSCLKFLLATSNLVLAVLGLMMIGGGVWLTVDQNQVEEIVGNISNYTASDIFSFPIWVLWSKERVSLSPHHLHHVHPAPHHPPSICYCHHQHSRQQHTTVQN